MSAGDCVSALLSGLLSSDLELSSDGFWVVVLAGFELSSGFSVVVTVSELSVVVTVVVVTSETEGSSGFVVVVISVLLSVTLLSVGI